MNHYFKSGIVLLTIGLVMTGCKKDEPVNNQPDPPEVTNSSKIELPETVSVTDIQIYETEGRTVSVNSDGTFNSHSDQLIAVDHEGRIVFLTCNSVDTVPYVSNSVLNAKETAISILLHIIPYAFETTAQEQFNALKQLIAGLPETQTLANAIENSVKNRRYCETDDFEQELKNAANAVYAASGIDDFLSQIQVKRNNAPTLRATTPELSARTNGFRLDMTESVYDENLQIWNCTFKAYSEWGCYLCIVPGILEGNGQVYVQTDHLLRYVIQPMNASKFKSGLTSWDTQKTYWTELWKAIFDDDFTTEDWTWDNSKLDNINMKFVAPEDVVVVMSPKDSPYLLAYNLVWLTAKPVIKSLFGGMKGEGGLETEFINGYCEKLASDDAFLQKLLYENLDWNDIVKYHLKKLRDYTTSYGATKLFPSLATNVLKDDALKAALGQINAIEKWVTVGLDATLMGVSMWKFETLTIDPQLSFPATIPAEGLIASYPFDGNANDVSGNGNHGTVSVATLTTGRKGTANSAYNFSGVSKPSFIKVSSSSSLNFDSNATYSFFVKLNNEQGMNAYGSTAASGFHCIFAKPHDMQGYTGLLRSGSDGLSISMGSFVLQSTGTDSSPDPLKRLNDGRWVHLVYVFEGNVSKIYVDGTLYITNTYTGNISAGNNKDLYFGKFSDQWYPLDGVLDDIRIYNRALSAGEIQALYNE